MDPERTNPSVGAQALKHLRLSSFQPIWSCFISTSAKALGGGNQIEVRCHAAPEVAALVNRPVLPSLRALIFYLQQ